MDTEDLTIRRRGRFATDDVGPAFIRVFHTGQVLYGSRRTYLKKIAVADFDGVTANTTFVLETKDEKVLRQRLIPFIMYTDRFTEWSIKKSKGSTNPYVLFSDLASYEFDLPSIEKQDELVELLWSMVEAKDAYTALITSIDELVKSQFIEMFGDPSVNPKGWNIYPLGDCCEVITGNTPPRAHSEYYGDHIEWIKSDNITDHSAFPTEAAEYLSLAGAEIGRVVPSKSILMTCIAGGIGSIGNIVMTDRPVAFNQQINALVPLKFDTWFLYYLLRLMRPQLQAATNKALKCILTKGNLIAIGVIVPDIEAQKEFSVFAQQTEKSKFELGRAIRSLEATYNKIISENLG